MTGKPMRIELVDNVTIKPLHVNVPHRTPYAYQKIAKAELDRLVELGILEKALGSRIGFHLCYLFQNPMAQYV